MNLKGVLGTFNPFRFDKTRVKESSSIKLDSSSDREGNGQQPFQKNSNQEPMNDEEFQESIEYLKSLPAIKEKGLVIEFQTIDLRRIVYLKEPSGKILRKISEFELRSIVTTKDKGKGQLLNKTA